jgi:hypothetical protein
MGYYAAGGYYSAGGFSFRKLARAVGRAASFVQKQPILSSVVGLIPGGSSVLSGATVVAGLAHAASAGTAVRTSQPGTPGMNAYHQVVRARRPRRVRRRRMYAY